jgi:hypothetical protein
VLKLEDGTYEVNRLGDVVRGTAPAARATQKAGAKAPGTEPPVQPEAEEREKVNGRRAGLRFRRGSRTTARKEEVAMVGVVTADDSGSAKTKSKETAAGTKSPKAAKKRKRSPRKKTASGATKTTTRKRAKSGAAAKASKQTEKPPAAPDPSA